MSSRRFPKRPWISAHAIIFDPKKRVLLTKRAAPPKQNHWFPPGGAIDVGETVEEGLKREIKEETDITVNNLRFVDFIDGITRNAEGEVVYHFVVFMYTANYLEGIIEAKDDALEVKWVSIQDVVSKKILVPEELTSILKKIMD
ncbi:MAG: NUDIX hydrolase [Candidatus Hodarchaeota archaeon]